MKVRLKVRCQAGQTLKTGAEPTAGTVTWLQPCDPATQICGPTTTRYPSPMEKAPQVQARSLAAASDLHTPDRYTVNPAQRPGHAWGSHPKSHTPCMVFTVPAETNHYYGINIRCSDLPPQDRRHAWEGQPPRKASPEFGRGGQGQGEWGPRGMGAGHPWSYLGLAAYLTSYRKPYGCGTLHTQSPAEWPLTPRWSLPPTQPTPMEGP